MILVWLKQVYMNITFVYNILKKKQEHISFFFVFFNKNFL